jgi:hypothetical protein
MTRSEMRRRLTVLEGRVGLDTLSVIDLTSVDGLHSIHDLAEAEARGTVILLVDDDPPD